MTSSLHYYLAKVFVLLIFIVSIFNRISAETNDSNQCQGADVKLKYYSPLKQALLCNYDKNTRPGSNEKNTTQIDLYIAPQLLKSDDQRSSITFGIRLMMHWEDPRLQWNHKDYGGIKRIRLDSDEFWTPEIAHDGNENYFTKMKCAIVSRGMIDWFLSTKYTTTCEADFSYWPYDTLNCTLSFYLPSYSNHEVNFIRNRLFMEPIVTDHKEWDLVSYESWNDTDGYKFDEKYDSSSVQVNIVLRSHGNNSRTAYVVPAFVMVVLTLTVLWLDPKSSERLFVAVCNFILHLMCLLNIFWQAPFNGISTPRLVVFYEKSLIVATFAFVTTAFLRELEEIQVSPPQWISSLAMTTMKSKIGNYLVNGVLDPKAFASFAFEASDNESLITAKCKNKSIWECISIMISTVMFLSVFALYSFLVLSYLL